MWCRAAFKAGGKRKGKINKHTYTHTHKGEGGRREREGEEKRGKKKGGVKEEVVRK